MQNRKWILTSLVMTFFGIPILAQFLAAVIAMLGVGLAGIIEVCNIFISKRKLTAVCSHQTRIGNLDAHLI
nr:hypothetical protein [Escherichia coli]